MSSYLPDFSVRDDPRKEKRITTVFVASCLVSTVSLHVRSTQKERGRSRSHVGIWAAHERDFQADTKAENEAAKFEKEQTRY